MNKIHVCCGGVYLDGYINIDKYPFEKGDDSRSGCVADVLADVFDLPYAKGSLSEIVLVHGMEHFTRYDGVRLLGKFAELLAPDGVLYLEMPSRNPVLFLTFVERVVALLAPRRLTNEFGRGPASSMLWGNQWAGFDYETHRYLWSAGEIARAGAALGLVHRVIHRLPASHVPFRDMGVALSRHPSVNQYRPPRIRRLARSGIAGDLMGLAWGVLHVCRTIFSARGSRE
jgi:SAM-dependent methyltransferase